MSQLRVLLGFADASDHEVETTATAVLDGLYKQTTVYPEPPVTAVALEAARDAFTTALGKQKSAGTEGTAAKEAARATLIGLLRELAGYVQGVIQKPDSGYGLAELLASGFEAVSSNRARHPLGAPTIKDIVNSGEGQLTLRVAPVPNARMYEVQKRKENLPGAPGAWESAGVFSSTRGMVVANLEPGAMYGFQVRAMGGTTGFSDWSDAVSHRSL